METDPWMGFFYPLGHFCQNLAHPLILPNYTHTHTPLQSAENLQNWVRQDAFPWVWSLCCLCNFDSGPKIPCKYVGLYWAGFLHLKMGSQKMGSSSFESYLKTMTMLSTSIHPIIPQQDLSSSGTQTCSCLLQLHYWILGLFILLWMLHAIQVPRRKTSSIVRTAFVCLALSLSAKEAIFTNSGSGEPLPAWP